MDPSVQLLYLLKYYKDKVCYLVPHRDTRTCSDCDELACTYTTDMNKSPPLIHV
jgi:hypothetical protein